MTPADAALAASIRSEQRAILVLLDEYEGRQRTLLARGRATSDERKELDELMDCIERRLHAVHVRLVARVTN